MRLSEFILKNIEPILQEWEDFARSIQPVHRDMDQAELRDHAEDFLRAIAEDLSTPQSDAHRDLKARGKGQRLPGDTAAEIHAETRLNSGFTLEQLVAEYRALRASVLRQWLAHSATEQRYQVEDLNRFNEAVDQGLSESVERYSKRVQQARDIFVGVIGHDLRTPLQSIAQGAEFLMLTSADAGVVQLGSRIFSSTGRMGAILDNLVDFTKSRTSGIPLARTQTDLAEITEQVLEEFRFSNPVRSIRLEVSGDVTGQLDSTRMGQVVQNLVSNALQYSPADSEVAICLSGDEDVIVLTVHNHGKPIDTNEQKNIFDPLQRYAAQHQQEKQISRNLGLGLFIVKEIVSAHLGTIGLTSCPNDGTRFTVLLPKLSVKDSAGRTACA